jgi:glycosyltransferase involved in cell wall biosynthesis
MISLIITTAPGREENLDACLKSIANQTLQPPEVIVTDDGESGAKVAEKWTSVLPLRYLSRPNDRCVSRSRNLAVAQASQDSLVFLDGDIILNPDGLKAYEAHFKTLPNALLGSYFGNSFAYVSPSALDKNREVNYIDRRFEACLEERFYPFGQLLENPGLFCWGGNIGISRQNYNTLNGFDENITGWGAEDIDFAFRALRADVEIHFCIDTWGEHQIHSRASVFHHKTKEEVSRGEAVVKMPHPPINYAVQAMGQTEQVKALHDYLVSFYTQQDSEIKRSLKAKLMKPGATLISRYLADQSLELGCAFSK